ncbi:MAG: phosphate acetyltransferase, partial [Solirubrobacteraceae bacterium]
MEPGSGKSVVALGLMETFAGKAHRTGFFRPIITADDDVPDPQLQLIRHRYQLDCPYERMYALHAREAQSMIAAGAHAELEQRVFEAYKRLEPSFDVIVCEGTDFAGVLPALDFDLNASLANQLGSPVLVVIRGSTVPDIAAAVRIAKASLQHKGCSLFGVIVNRVAPELMAAMREHSVIYDPGEPMYVLAENAALRHPTVAQVATELHAAVLAGEQHLHQSVREVRVAAMNVEHFLEDLVDGMLVIVPGDRADIVLASVAASALGGLPPVAGIVLTGGYQPAPPIEQLLGTAPFAVLGTDARTYQAATAVHAIVPRLTVADAPQLATAIGVFEAGVDPDELAQRVQLPRPAVKTPMMFQYELLERAKARRRHIVLPEGEDERVLRAADILLRRDVVDLTILGRPDAVRGKAAALGLALDAARLVDPRTDPRATVYAARYHELRKHKGMTAELALDVVAEGSYFGTLMVQTGAADGMVSGAVHTTADTIRPAFEIIKSSPGVSVVSSVFFMCLADRVLVYGDCAVNPRPDAEQLADIAIGSAQTATRFGVDARIA